MQYLDPKGELLEADDDVESHLDEMRVYLRESELGKAVSRLWAFYRDDTARSRLIESYVEATACSLVLPYTIARRAE